MDRLHEVVMGNEDCLMAWMSLKALELFDIDV